LLNRQLLLFTPLRAGMLLTPDQWHRPGRPDGRNLSFEEDPNEN
jgi:hypothetical protein